MSSMGAYTLPYVKQIASGNWLYGSGSSNWGSVTTERGGMGLEVGGGTYVYVWLIHVDVWQKPAQYCKAIILQLKKRDSLSPTAASGRGPAHQRVQDSALPTAPESPGSGPTLRGYQTHLADSRRKKTTVSKPVDLASSQ